MKFKDKMNYLAIFDYLKLILRKWIFWLFLLLDIGGALVEFLIPSFNLPTNIYGLLAIIGFFWAGYQVHTKSIESHQKIIRRLSTELNVDAILQTPKVNIQLIEGYEYIFNLTLENTLQQLVADLSEQAKSSPKNKIVPSAENNNAKYFLPSSRIEINVRVENLGCALDILVISTDWDKEYELLSLYLGEVLLNNSAAQYPIHLKPILFLNVN